MTKDYQPDADSFLVVDLGALSENYRQLTKRASPAVCAPLLKANAYGIGLEQAAHALSAAGANVFFVAQLAEGRALRALRPEATIYVLNGILQNTAYAYADTKLRPVLNSQTEIAEWSRLCRTREEKLPAALHVDTGMNRLGLSPEEAMRIAEEDELLKNFEPCLLLTHLANSENFNHPFNAQQINLFQKISTMFPTLRTSLNNSSGLFMPQSYHDDVIRTGYALYGGNPTPYKGNPMQAVLTLYARIVQIRTVQAGETIGYHGCWTALDDQKIAILSLGYADGYPRAAGWTGEKPRGMVLVSGVRCPVVGHISMDLMAVDVTAVPDSLASPGDIAELFGKMISLEEVANWSGTIGYEILAQLGQRPLRVYVNKNNAASSE
ncbi:MAG: alanine racemase [Alphaproteobacteria bacterium]|nr:alanine racemase [Alphaproteobacteria bacterium]